jgi:proteasome lid subunit RPN8/RPN11
MEVFLEEEAFLGLLLSAVETYKRECFGSLLGYVTGTRIIVELAIPTQAADRKFSTVEPDWKRLAQSKKILSRHTTYSHLGYFHSHPQFGKKRYGTAQSTKDIDTMGNSELEMIVAINDRLRPQKWKTIQKELRGSVDDYSIRITAYYKNSGGKINKYPISCPFATGLPILENLSE